MKKINHYSKSKRFKITIGCIVYARERAIEWLGNTACHQCDESCDHQCACDGCKFYLNDSDTWTLGVPGITCSWE